MIPPKPKGPELREFREGFAPRKTSFPKSEPERHAFAVVPLIVACGLLAAMLFGMALGARLH